MPLTSGLSEAELHGIVDNQVTADLRPEMLARAAGSPLDRERVANWREQSDMIRDLFRGVEQEPLPTALSLRPPCRVVPATSAPGWLQKDGATGGGPRRALSRWLHVAATVAVTAGGLAAAWIASGSLPPRHADAALASAADDAPVRDAVAAIAIEGQAGVVAASTALPTRAIPDLSAFGFAFSAAEMRGATPAALVFRYRNGAAEQVALAVARRSAMPASMSEARTGAFAWWVGETAYAVAGTLDRDRLRAIAVSLRAVSVER